MATDWGGGGFPRGGCFFTTTNEPHVTTDDVQGVLLILLIGHDHPFIQFYFIANFTEYALPVLRTVVVGATIVVGATVLVALGVVRVCSLTTDRHGWPRMRGG